MLRKIPLLVIALLLFTACGEKSIHQKIVGHLDDTYEAEMQFTEMQEELLQLETRDLAIYDEIVQLDEVETDKLKQLFTESYELIEEREAYLKLEREALEESEAFFVLIEPYMDEINDENIKELIEKMYETMLERYDVYHEIYEGYMESLQLTESLYEQLENHQSQQILYDLLDEVNESYEQLFKANEQFNRLTKRYNRYKREYYERVWE